MRNWLVAEGRLTANPVAHVKTCDERVDRKKARRALSAAEIGKMLETTASGQVHHGMTTAGISDKDEQGRIVDFHALRHTFGSMLAAAGVRPKVAQDLMRHSTIDLTMNIYTHAALESRMEALDKLPDIQAQQPEDHENSAMGSA